MVRHLTYLLLGVVLITPVSRSQGTDRTNSTATQDEKKSTIKRIYVDSKDTASAKPKIKHAVPPIYPSEAKREGIQGTVQVHVIIGKDGDVLKAEPVSGDPLLAKSALHAVQQWKYEPTLLKGEFVEVDTVVEVEFRLELPLPANSQSAS